MSGNPMFIYAAAAAAALPRNPEHLNPVAVGIEKDAAAYWLRYLTNEDWAALILAQCAERDIDAVGFLRERVQHHFVERLGS